MHNEYVEPVCILRNICNKAHNSALGTVCHPKTCEKLKSISSVEKSKKAVPEATRLVVDSLSIPPPPSVPAQPVRFTISLMFPTTFSLHSSMSFQPTGLPIIAPGAMPRNHKHSHSGVLTAWMHKSCESWTWGLLTEALPEH